MTDLIKRALTRKITVKRGRGLQTVEVTPSAHLVLGVKCVIAFIVILSGLEVAHMAFLASWSEAIFATITGLIGSVVATFFTQRV